jgi:hypothetical protein
MARVSTGLLAGAVGFGVIAAAAIGVRAQGLVTIQKLSALLANELVGEAVAGEHVQTDRCPKPQPSGTASRHGLPYGQNSSAVSSNSRITSEEWARRANCRISAAFSR